jgi:hypothetical protein
MHAYRDLTGLTRTAVFSVYAYMAVDLLYGLYMAWMLSSPPDPKSGQTEILPLLALLTFLAFVGSAIVVGRWIYLAVANAHAISNEMTVTPGWAVGSYFVPILNLFKPFQGMKEAWLASHHRSNWHAEPTPGLLILWWTLWLATNILGNISFRLMLENEDGSLTGAIATLDILTSILDVPLCLVLIAMMNRVWRAQDHARHDQTFA